TVTARLSSDKSAQDFQLQLQFSRDGRRVAMVAMQRPPSPPSRPEGWSPPRQLTVWDTATGKQVAHLDLPPSAGFTASLAVRDSTGDRAVVSTQDRSDRIGDVSRLQLFDLSAGREIWSREIVRLYGGSGSAAFSPDGRKIAVATPVPTSKRSKLFILDTA